MPNPRGPKGNSTLYPYPRASGPRDSLASSNFYTFLQIAQLGVEVLEVAVPVRSCNSLHIVMAYVDSKYADRNEQMKATQREPSELRD